MPALIVDQVSKTFGATRAVDNLSFEVKTGEIFAMLGPNGAGKTTTIRIVLDILRPDHGHIRLFGQPISQPIKDRIGYLPEERGLYHDITVIDCLTYLATLKGVDGKHARARATDLLARVDLQDAMTKKVSALSRGMQQKAQFLATILHDPDLVIIDEPFSGLEHVNTLLIKELIYEIREQGKTIIMSTHMMHQVQEMADRMLMVNRGRSVLYGRVDDIRRQYASHAVYVNGSGQWADLPGVASVAYDRDRRADLVELNPGVSADDFLRAAAGRPDFHINRFEVALPSLDEIFIDVVGGRRS